MTLFYFLGLSIVHEFYLRRDLIIVPLIFIILYSFVSIQNFLVDREVDKANKKDNPFNANVKINVKKVNTTLFLITSVLLLLSENFFIIFINTIFLVLFGIFYSSSVAKLSYHHIGKFVLMLIGYCLIPGIIGIGYKPLDLYNISIIVAITLLYGSHLIYSDVKDIKGDRKYHKRTLALELGITRLPILGIFLTFSSLIIIFLLDRTRISLSLYAIIGVTTAAHFLFLFNPNLLNLPKWRYAGGYLMLLFLIILVFSFS